MVKLGDGNDVPIEEQSLQNAFFGNGAAISTFVVLYTILTTGILGLILRKFAELAMILIGFLFMFWVIVAGVLLSYTVFRYWQGKMSMTRALTGANLLLIVAAPLLLHSQLGPPTLDESKGYCDRVLLPFLKEYKSENGQFPESLDSVLPDEIEVPSNVYYQTPMGYLLHIVDPYRPPNDRYEWGFYETDDTWDLWFSRF